jgi:hypothetical protein
MLLFYQFSNMIYIITPLQDRSTNTKMYIVEANFSLFQFSDFFLGRIKAVQSRT